MSRNSEVLSKLAEDASVALLAIDQQADFEPGGALPVAGGDEIAEPISEWMARFQTVVVTQDSHPLGHISFASSYVGKKPYDVLTMAEVKSGEIQSAFSQKTLEAYLSSVPQQQQVLWPDHCVIGTRGWFMDLRLKIERAHLILRKGTRLTCDSYSAFFENDGTATGLAQFLRARGIKSVVCVGLAGDYCVYWSAKDALREGFKVFYVEELTRFVNFPENSKTKALEDLRVRGVELL